MPRRARKVAAIVGVAAVAAGAGIGVANQSSSSASGTTAAMTQPGGQPGGLRGLDVTALAKQLGVSTAKLQSALDAARPAGAPGGPPAGGQPPSGAQPPAGGPPASGGANRLASALAKQLGLSTTKVQAALDATRSAS
jgi:hypothetical protein